MPDAPLSKSRAGGQRELDAREIFEFAGWTLDVVTRQLTSPDKVPVT